MREAAADLEFEEAARLRDEIKRLQDHDLGLDKPGMPGVGGAVGFADRIAQAGAASQARKGKYANSRGQRRGHQTRISHKLVQFGHYLRRLKRPVNAQMTEAHTRTTSD